MMKCNDCGWNTTLTSMYCEEAKRQGASFAVPATHPYWGLSKKAHPSATVTGLATAAAAGSATTSTGKNDGLSSTISSRMNTWINDCMTQTKSSEVASLLSELKSCLSGN